MSPFEDLERRLAARPPAPRGRGVVRLICLRREGGAHECPPRAALSIDGGVAGDRWAASPRKNVGSQVTLMQARVAEALGDGRLPLETAGDNLVVDLELAEDVLPAGTRLRAGGVLLEVTDKPHLGCKKFGTKFGDEGLAWVNADPSRRLRGVNCRVIEPGEITVGDPIESLGVTLGPGEANDPGSLT